MAPNSTISILDARPSTHVTGIVASAAAAVGVLTLHGPLIAPAFSVPAFVPIAVGAAIVTVAAGTLVLDLKEKWARERLRRAVHDINMIVSSPTLSREEKIVLIRHVINDLLAMLNDTDGLDQTTVENIIEWLMFIAGAFPELAQIIYNRLLSKGFADLLDDMGYTQNTPGGGSGDPGSGSGLAATTGGGGGGAGYACFGYDCSTPLASCYGTFCYPISLA